MMQLPHLTIRESRASRLGCTLALVVVGSVGSVQAQPRSGEPKPAAQVIDVTRNGTRTGPTVTRTPGTGTTGTGTTGTGTTGTGTTRPTVPADQGSDPTTTDLQPEPPQIRPPTPSFTPRTLTPANVDDFVVWAGRTPRAHRERVRQQIGRASDKEAIVAKLAETYSRLIREDYDLALIALSIAGELRTRAAIPFLSSVLFQALPQSDTLDPDPGLTRRESVELLQSKAVQGLAYLEDLEADQLVVKAITTHPSRAARSSAIEALLYNAKNSSIVQRSLAGLIAPEDRVLLEQFRRAEVKDATELNLRLEDFYARYPEHRAAEPGEPTELPEESEPEPPELPGEENIVPTFDR